MIFKIEKAHSMLAVETGKVRSNRSNLSFKCAKTLYCEDIKITSSLYILTENEAKKTICTVVAL